MLPTASALATSRVVLISGTLNGRDHRDHPERLADRHRELARRVRRNGFAPHIAAQAGGGAHHGQALVEFEHRLLDRRADLVDQAIEQLGLARLHDLGHAQQPAFAVLGQGFPIPGKADFAAATALRMSSPVALRRVGVKAVVQRVEHLEGGAASASTQSPPMKC